MIGQQRVLDLPLVHRTDAHVGGRLLPRELLQHIDQHISNEVLAGGDPDLLWAGVDLERAAQLVGSFQERERVRQEASACLRENRQSARPTDLSIQLDTYLRFEREQSIAQPLLSDRQDAGRGPELTMARYLDERGDLVGTKVGDGLGHTTIKVITPTINNYIRRERPHYDDLKGG